MYAEYTTSLRKLMNLPEANAEIQKALSTYPLYSPEKIYDLIPTREELNTKILNHFKYREIGFETFGRFVDELAITMNEIMPHYNEMFKTVEIMAELPSPFDNVDVTETFEQTTTGSSSAEGTTTGSSSGSSSENGSSSDTSTTEQTTNSKSIGSDTPANVLNIGTKNIDSVNCASNAAWDESIENSSGSHTSENERNVSNTSEESGTTSSSSESTATTTHTFKKVGNQGVNTYAHDMNEFRTSIIDVVDQIINDPRLDELFMQIY